MLRFISRSLGDCGNLIALMEIVAVAKSSQLKASEVEAASRRLSKSRDGSSTRLGVIAKEP